jgi:nucleotide-binding universal stress UspA family protein
LPEADLVRRCKDRLEALARQEAKGVPCTCRVEIGAPVERILAAARGADTIVMSTLGRTGLPHLVIGSIAERVVRHAPVPVLSLRSRPGRARSRRRTRRRR